MSELNPSINNVQTPEESVQRIMRFSGEDPRHYTSMEPVGTSSASSLASKMREARLAFIAEAMNKGGGSVSFNTAEKIADIVEETAWESAEQRLIGAEASKACQMSEEDLLAAYEGDIDLTQQD